MSSTSAKKYQKSKKSKRFFHPSFVLRADCIDSYKTFRAIPKEFRHVAVWIQSLVDFIQTDSTFEKEDYYRVYGATELLLLVRHQYLFSAFMQDIKPELSILLNTIGSFYNKYKEEKPSKEIIFDMYDNHMKNCIWGDLQYQWAFDIFMAYKNIIDPEV